VKSDDICGDVVGSEREKTKVWTTCSQKALYCILIRSSEPNYSNLGSTGSIAHL
jgi:hypothetical protein